MDFFASADVLLKVENAVRALEELETDEVVKRIGGNEHVKKETVLYALAAHINAETGAKTSTTRAFLSTYRDIFLTQIERAVDPSSEEQPTEAVEGTRWCLEATMASRSKKEAENFLKIRLYAGIDKCNIAHAVAEVVNEKYNFKKSHVRNAFDDDYKVGQLLERLRRRLD